MPGDQSNRQIGLLVPWDPDGAGPAHQRLAAALRHQVNNGRLRPGDRLPPTRILAEELGLSRWVITEAYDQLKAEGYLTGRVGSGTVVAGVRETGTVRTASGSSSARRATPGPGTGELPPGLSGTVDLSPALPDLASFPRTAWRAALTRALATASDVDLGYPDPAGAPALRTTMAAYLRRVRGLDTDPERVHVTQGVRNAVALVSRALRSRGARRVAVEDPSWPRMRDISRAAGLDVVPVPVDRDGIRVDRLPGLDVDAVFVTPTHQFPTGVPLSASRRVALIEWATARDGIVVEDDYDAEFRYDRRPVGALATRARDRVVYLGSTSKTLSPALHLGWMIAPARLDDALAAARDGIGTLAPTLDQLALAALISTGAYDRHLRRLRGLYRHRRTALLTALSASVPGSAYASMDAGVHVLWQLPDDTDETAVLTEAGERGLSLLGLTQCRVGPGPPGLVLGYGNLPEHRAPGVAEALADAVRAAGGR
ncbi:MAG: GntR family transcriptional regulator / MocR family aminotransferase [Actinomycetota bacterium]|nr:GntR family transcriptional regulator / MocR family aminotransferase [Actinomycetota bacterium]